MYTKAIHMAAGGEQLAEEQPPYELHFARGRGAIDSRPCHCGRSKPPAV